MSVSSRIARRYGAWQGEFEHRKVRGDGFFGCVLAMLLLALIIAPPAHAGVNDFYFSSADFDYTLVEDAESGAKLKVKETLTAVFPDKDQNHGIERAIPYTNQNGQNATIRNLNITVTRNGEVEPFKTSKEDGYYYVRIGRASSYVHGKQTYVLEYEFENVITEFSANGINLSGLEDSNIAFQELYWDTNGTGWSQKFDSLTATLHLPSGVSYDAKKTSCYVGYSGSSDQSRCKISQSANTITFSAENLRAHENLTFAVDFPSQYFTVIRHENYVLLIVYVIVGTILLLILFFTIKKYRKDAAEKRKYYKSIFLAPEFTPLDGLTVAPASDLAMFTTKPAMVATLIECAIRGQVKIIKGEPTKILHKDTWKVEVKSLRNITNAGEYVLAILNGGKKAHEGDTIEIKRRTASSSAESYLRQFNTSGVNTLKNAGLFESSADTSIASVVVTTVIIMAAFCTFVPATVAALIDEFLSTPGVIIGLEYLPIAAIIAFILLVTIITIATTTSKYKKYTMKGIEQARRLEGLKLYISMAETERLEFNQSTTGAPTDNKGIVKLYEKLLPYAIIFGLENSWMKELNKYYDVLGDSYNPTWTSDHALLTAAAFSAMNTSVASGISSASSYSSSSGSSGGSGGGGGGFSGGGGGGGGGGGW